MSATPNKKELIIGIVMISLSLAYAVMAYQLPGHDGIDAGTLPVLLAGFLALLGVMQLINAVTSKPAPASSATVTPASDDLPKVVVEEAPPPVVEPRTVILTLGLILGYVALMGYVGFPIMTVVYLYLQFLVLTPVTQKAKHLTYLLISVISSAVIFLLFREAFDLLLPAGLLNNFI